MRWQVGAVRGAYIVIMASVLYVARRAAPNSLTRSVGWPSCSGLLQPFTSLFGATQTRVTCGREKTKRRHARDASASRACRRFVFSRPHVTLVCVAPNKLVKGWSSPEHDGHPTLRVSELGAALRATYKTDAMMTMYAPLTAPTCHRINKAGAANYHHPLFVTCFLADWDTPGHKPWAHPDQAREL